MFVSKPVPRAAYIESVHLYRATIYVSAVFFGSVRLSVCLSVTFVYCIQRAKDIVKLLSRHASTITLDS